jgi:hypothetical protein
MVTGTSLSWTGTGQWSSSEDAMKRQVVGLVTVAMLALAACSRDGGKPSSSTEPAARPAAAATTSTASNDSAAVTYHPVIVPADFSTRITNPYFPLKPGTTYRFDGLRDGAPQHTEMTVTSETKKIMGVSTVVVRDVVTSNGALVEKTTDWYAQKRNGDVWYFGEATAEYENGKITNTQDHQHQGLLGGWRRQRPTRDHHARQPPPRRRLPAGVPARGGPGHGKG